MDARETPVGDAEAVASPSFSARPEEAQVRRATAADARILHEIAAATFPLACPPDTTADSIRAFITLNLSVTAFEGYLADPKRELQLAEMAGTAVGYTMLVFGEPADADAAASITTRPTVELSKCYVDEGQHGSGVAAALVDTSIAASRSRGASSMWLGVNQHNRRANRFYDKHGFRVVGTKRFLVGDRLEEDFVRERVF